MPLPNVTTTESIIAYNRGRIPALLALKWERMGENAFAFFRGTAPLFYENWARLSPGSAPLAWICGDAHMENLGSYRGANRVPYFDLNDFDECCRAPADWETGRALAALYVLGRPDLARLFLSAYVGALRGRQAGPYRARGRRRAASPSSLRRSRLAAARNSWAKWIAHGKMIIRPGHSYALGRAAKAGARRKFEAWARRQPDRDFYRVLDICGRIAGNGSLGLERFIILVKGRKLPFILDMKAAASEAPRAFLRARQPAWPSEAERVATVQHFMQYVPIARLSWMGTAPVSYIVHALQPADDRIVVADLSPSATGNS